MGKEKTSKHQRFGDVFNKIEFPECPQVELVELLGYEITVKDAVIKKFHHGEVAIMKVRPGEEYWANKQDSDPDNSTPVDVSTLCGGSVVVDKLKQAKENNMLPMDGVITKEQGDNGKYYDIR